MNVVSINPLQQAEIPFQLNTSVDLSDINNEKLLSLKLSHAAFKISQKKLADELFISSQQLHLMHEILGERIFQFAQEEFGIAPKTVKRYLHSYKMMTAHLSTDGRIDLKEVRQFTQTALQLLSEDTNENVILEIRNIAQSGGTVNEATLRQLLEQQSGDYEARVAAALAEASSAKRNLATISEKHELAVSRAEKIQRDAVENERRLLQQLEGLEEEKLALQAASIQVHEKKVPTVPEEYASLEAAIADATKKHTDLSNKISTIRGELALIEENKASIKADFEALKVSVEDVNKFKTDIDNAFLKMPQSRLITLASTDKGIAAILTELGNELIARGQQLCAIK